MATETIEYRYSDDGRYARGEWTGEWADAVAAAVDHLRAVRDEDHDAWTYVAQETHETWRVEESDLATLGAALLALGGRGDVYSVWCTESGERVTVIETPDGTTIDAGDYVVFVGAMSDDELDWGIVYAEPDGSLRVCWQESGGYTRLRASADATELEVYTDRMEAQERYGELCDELDESQQEGA